MPPLSCNRIVGLGIATFILIVFIFATLRHGGGPVQTIKDAAHQAASSAQHFCSNNDVHDVPHLPRPSPSSIQNAMSILYDSIKHPVTAEDYVDPYGMKFNVSDNPTWTEPLGSEVLIVDMDTRAPDGENEIFGPEKINWETMSTKEGGGMLSASFLNHYIYSQIHGYSYKFYRAQPMEPSHHNTWIKPHVIDELLHSYRFVVFIDADATINHLEIPLEWLFNRWGITPKTSIAMPLDTQQMINGDDKVSFDSKGNLTLNTGFVIAQAMPYTFEMMHAWKTCTDGQRYPECPLWTHEWSHEQRAFSEHIRYDFNPDNNIVTIPCDDAMGYPGLAANHPHILSDCKGQFVRHHTIDKGMTKTDTANAMVQTLAQIMQQTLLQNKKEVWVTEGEDTREFMKEFKEKAQE